MKVSKKAAGIAPSLTLALTAKAKEMKASGIDVVGFGAGEPDFDTPEFIKERTVADLKGGMTKYTPVRGTPVLIDAVREALRRDYGLDYEAAQILISIGGKHSLFNLFFCLLDEGDEVIVPAPYWLSYPEQIRACGGVVKVVDCGPAQGFKMTPVQLAEAITPQTVAVVLNSPGNPTGAVYTRDELLGLAEVFREHPKVAIISDDLYMKLVYEPAEFASLPALAPDLLDRTIIVNGLSKGYSMTGWRLGWMAAPKELAAAASALQGQSTSNPVSFIQGGAAEALLSDHAFLGPWRDEFRKRRDTIVRELNAIPGVQCTEPDGAFYVFPNVSGLYGREVNGFRIEDSMSLANALLEGANVSLVPGVAFGEDRCVRLSYATSLEAIEKGLTRITEFFR